MKQKPADETSKDKIFDKAHRMKAGSRKNIKIMHQGYEKIKVKPKPTGTNRTRLV